MFNFVMVLPFSAEVNFSVLRDPESSACSAVVQSLLHPLCDGAFVSDKPFPQQNCRIGFVFVAGKEADCCLLYW